MSELRLLSIYPPTQRAGAPASSFDMLTCATLALLPFASGSELRTHPEAKCRHALESTITSHDGTPQPGNPRTREAGAAASSCAPRVVVVGGAVVDLLCVPDKGTPLLPRTSTPGHLEMASGGVARNVADGLARLGAAPLLASAVGDDGLGAQVRAKARARARVRVRVRVWARVRVSSP